MPLLAAPLRIGECPHCNGVLRGPITTLLTEEEAALAKRRLGDLEFLLTPSTGTDEAASNYSATIPGYWLSCKRREIGLTQVEVARGINEKPIVIGSIDRGDVAQGPKFAAYLKYADYLGVSLEEIFTTPPPVMTQEAPTGLQKPHELSKEDQLACRVLEAIKTLKAEGRGVSQSAVRRLTGISKGGLEYYPRVKGILNEVEAERQREELLRALKREEELRRQVERAIIQLRTDGELISQTKISRLIRVARGSLNYYPSIRTIIRTAAEGEYGVGSGSNGKASVVKGLSEDAVLVQVERARQSLQSRGKPVTQVAVARLVNMSTGRLRRYSRVKLLLDGVASERRNQIQAQKRAREDVIRERVITVIEALKREGLPATQLSISERIGLSVPTLLYYRSIRMLVEPLEVERWAAIKDQQHSKEEMLEVAVLEAVTTLREEGRAATQGAISEIVGMTAGGMRKYPRVRAMLQELVPQAKVESTQRRDEEEKALVTRVLLMIVSMEMRGEKVTYNALAPLLGRTASCLRRHPQIRNAVEASRANPRNGRWSNESEE